MSRMLRRRSLERRLFGWLLALALGPALVVLVLATWLWGGALDWAGTLGPWGEVAQSGRELFEAAQSAAAQDPALQRAVEAHQRELSSSLVLARRWAFLGGRVAALLPLLALVLAVAIALVVLAASRRLARELARPIQELVGWTELLARDEPLPAEARAERREVREVRALRGALRQAAQDLQAARRRALEAERVRMWGEMARRVAHEMKNPLTPLRLAAHRLAQLGAAVSPAREPLAVIEEETARLEELAGEFAALGSPPGGPASAVDLRELLAALLATDVPAGVSARLDGPAALPSIQGRYEPLFRAFRNLVRNAVESVAMRDAPREVEVRLSALPANGGGACIEVVIADNGPGLPPDAAERVFEPGFTTKARGTGLGLALVRQAVLAHAGSVAARARPGGGAEFVVRLPISAEPVS